MYDRTLIGLVPSFHTKATPSSPSESVGDAVIAKLRKDLQQFQSMSDTKGSAGLKVESTAEHVIVRVPFDNAATIEITVAKEDLLRAYVKGSRGVPRGLPSSATLTLAPL
jgi:hypothetical protein